MIKTVLTVAILLIAQFSYSQDVDTIFLDGNDIKIHTVLTKPEGIKSPPLAIIISGSGPTDLNGNQPIMSNNSLQYLSDALVANNIATLRYDKRGVGQSVSKDFKESDLTIETYANDLDTIINHFKQKKLKFKNIYLIGHSEGSLIALMEAQNNSVKGFVSLCGAGNSADVLLKKQLEPKLPKSFYTQVESIIDSLDNGHQINKIPPQLYSLFRPSVQPYMISWFKYHPTELIQNLDCPVLIVQGEKDIQVDLEEAGLLAESTSNGQMVVIKDMNHVLKTIQGDILENMASYTNPDLPINKDLIQQISEFINVSNEEKKRR